MKVREYIVENYKQLKRLYNRLDIVTPGGEVLASIVIEFGLGRAIRQFDNSKVYRYMDMVVIDRKEYQIIVDGSELDAKG